MGMFFCFLFFWSFANIQVDGCFPNEPVCWPKEFKERTYGSPWKCENNEGNTTHVMIQTEYK